MGCLPGQRVGDLLSPRGCTVIKYKVTYGAARNGASLQLVFRVTRCSWLSQTAQVRTWGSQPVAKPSTQPSTL